MRCLGEFKDDGTCLFCKLTLNKIYEECKKIYNKETVKLKKLRDIEHKCSNRDDSNQLYICKLNGHFCNVTLECEKYCKEEN